MNRHYHTLELEKILNMLKEETSIKEAGELALKLEPQYSLDKVEQLLTQTEDAHMLIGRFGAPSFGGISNVANPLRRAEAGGCLNTSELLSIARALRVIKGVRDWHAHCSGVTTTLDGYFRNTTAPWLMQQFVSNHYAWVNKFDKTRRLRLGGTLDFPLTWTRVGVHYENILVLLAQFHDLVAETVSGGDHFIKSHCPVLLSIPRTGGPARPLPVCTAPHWVPRRASPPGSPYRRLRCLSRSCR